MFTVGMVMSMTVIVIFMFHSPSNP
jgi:hypothetical protein